MDCLWNVCGLLGMGFQRELDWISTAICVCGQVMQAMAA